MAYMLLVTPNRLHGRKRRIGPEPVEGQDHGPIAKVNHDANPPTVSQGGRLRPSPRPKKTKTATLTQKYPKKPSNAQNRPKKPPKDPKR